MMSIKDLLAELSELDIRLWVSEGTLHFNAPEGSFNEELRKKVLAIKPELIAFLEKERNHPLIAPEPPQTETEKRLALLWSEFLNSDNISRNDDFFILGGHSLLLMRLVHRIESSGMGNIDLAQAMSARTLKKMALLLDNAGNTLIRLPEKVFQPSVDGPNSVMPCTSSSMQSDDPYPRDLSLAHLWKIAAKRHGSLTAMVYGDECISYQQLDEWSSRIAAGLLAEGVRAGCTVALALQRKPEAVAALIAVLKCGAAYLPLDEKMPPMLTASLLALSDAHWLIADLAGRERLLSLAEIRILPLEKLTIISALAAIPEIPETCGSDPAYIMFTSGSTGEPKGVIVPHRAVIRLALDKNVLALNPGDAMAQTAPFGFDASTLEIWGTLLSGASLVFIEESLLMQPEWLGDYLHKKGVVAMWLTASLVNRIADLRPEAFDPLKVLLTGGEVLSIPHIKTVMAACPNLQILNGYGPTENTTFTTLHAVTATDLLASSIPIGRPIAHTRVYVLDEELSPAEIGTWGELCAAGDGLAIGYAGRKDLTDKSFVSLPAHPEERIYRTGDLARWRKDGVLEFGGRRDGQIKLRGHRVETSAIEATLSGCLGVHDALVMVDGEGETKELVAFIASSNNEEMAWRHHLAERLPIYMMPARFIVMDSLPITSNGKKDREALSRILHKETAFFPLSNGQERLWILQRLTPDSAFYNIPSAFEIKGNLDVAAFKRALISLEKRHLALRLLICPADDNNHIARQRLVAAGNLSPLTLDFSRVADPEGATNEKMLAETIRPFHLEHETPGRSFLFKLHEDHWRFLMVIHHIACDGWSLGILLHDLATFYALETGVPATPLSPIKYQLSDYVDSQITFLKSEASQQMLDRRIKRLSPPLEPLDLPTDHPRPLNRNFGGRTLHFPFDSSISQSLDQLARDCEVTPFVLLLAIVELLLYRLSGHQRVNDFALGALTSGRDRTELSELVGFFVNTLAIPCHLKPDQTFHEHLACVKEEWQAALSDQQCPFGKLVECLNLSRDLARNPLFDVLVVWQDSFPEAPALPGLKSSSIPTNLPFAKFDLSFNFLRKEREIELFLEFSGELFEEPTITRFAGRLLALIAAVTEKPDALVAELNIWLPGEKKQVIEDFNDTALALPTQRSIPEPFLDRVLTHSSDPAVFSADGERTNYIDFARRAGAIAEHIKKAGVQRGQRVAMLLPRSPEMLAAIFGIVMAGAVYVPLDPNQPLARLRDIFDDLHQPFVLIDGPMLPELSGSCRYLSLPAPESNAEPLCLAAPDDLAYIIYTSGSTGKPKGVLIEHQAVLNRILWMQSKFPILRGDVILQKTPITFDVSIWELFWWSWSGAAVAMLKPGDEKDPEALAKAIEKHQVTIIHFVPSMLTVFLDSLCGGHIEYHSLSSLRVVFVSGEALDPVLAERFNQLLYDRYGTELHNLYGPTEATVDVSWQAASPWSGEKIPSIGRPIANTTLYILDENHQPLPAGISGEIAIGGIQVARGYLNRPELTLERFITDQFNPKGRIYLTGDTGRWKSDGSIEYLGRSDWQVKIRGQRIEPGEIEHVLERCGQIKQAVVVPALNNNVTELHAWIVCEGSPDIGAVRHFLRQHLPESMIPARFFPLKELPLALNGKLDRKYLEQHSKTIVTSSPQPLIPKSRYESQRNTALTTSFHLDESSETLTLSLCFNTAMISPDERAALARDYSSLLKEIASQSSDLHAPSQTTLPSQRDTLT
ncbi:MAG: amino acid adenylation domain-containing protein [Chlorobium sp.]|nr:MAG: amino acid adenylation domain-containing protein [Chlorobium sp.]